MKHLATKPIPWSRILLEWLIIIQLVRTFSTICGTQGFISIFTRVCYWFISCTNRSSSHSSILFKIHFSIILASGLLKLCKHFLPAHIESEKFTSALIKN